MGMLKKEEKKKDGIRTSNYNIKRTEQNRTEHNQIKSNQWNYFLRATLVSNALSLEILARN